VFERLRSELRAKYGFDADFEHMAVFGTCDRCRG